MSFYSSLNANCEYLLYKCLEIILHKTQYGLQFNNDK